MWIITLTEKSKFEESCRSEGISNLNQSLRRLVQQSGLILGKWCSLPSILLPETLLG